MKTWHRDTAVDIQPGMAVDQQLKTAGLDWQVNLSPVFYGDEKQHKAPVIAAYRSDNNAFFDIYTKRKPWQNAEIVETFNRFCDGANLPISYLGNLDGGRILYAAAKLPEMIAPAQSVGDLTEGYLLLEDSHLNGRGLSISIYANRLVCTNGMKRPVRLGQKIISHVGQFNPSRVHGILTAARETLQQEQKQMTDLATVTIDKAEATLQLIAAFGEAGKPVHEQPRIVQTCLKLFNGAGMGSGELSAFNTAYGLLQSVTEYYNHHAVKRGTTAQQFQSLLCGSRAQQMQRFERQVVRCYLS
jgi:phage/plasmid-like protein (TIGR03299 family)